MDFPNPSFVLLFPISELYSLLAEDSPLTHRIKKWLEGMELPVLQKQKMRDSVFEGGYMKLFLLTVCLLHVLRLNCFI